MLRIPAQDDVVTMTLKLDVGADVTDENEETPSDSASGANTAPNQEWEDEDKFMTFTLRGGALLPMEPPTAAAVRQRLYNLGYGPPNPDNWQGTIMQNAIKPSSVIRGCLKPGMVTSKHVNACVRFMGVDSVTLSFGVCAMVSSTGRRGHAKDRGF